VPCVTVLVVIHVHEITVFSVTCIYMKYSVQCTRCWPRGHSL